jgi:DNA-binding FadR family transcriptional regulator
MAEIVAASLRDAILDGELTVVPRLEDLVEQYDVGPPAAREAMRILETEGLITVRRGNVGGAEVHLPTNARVAYMLGLVLQSSHTTLRDVGTALRELEPMCAVLCAGRPDRGEAVVPTLRELVAEQEAAIGDHDRTMEAVDRFHGAIVELCGNETLRQVVGSLERIWATHVSAVYESRDAEPPLKVWKAAVRDHQRIVDAIERGDPKVQAMAAEHLEATQAFVSDVDDAKKVTASIVGGTGRL